MITTIQDKGLNNDDLDGMCNLVTFFTPGLIWSQVVTLITVEVLTSTMADLMVIMSLCNLVIWSHLATYGHTWQLFNCWILGISCNCWSHIAVNNAITPFCYLLSCWSQLSTAGHMVRSGHICWLIISKGWSVQVCGGIISAISILPNLKGRNSPPFM